MESRRSLNDMERTALDILARIARLPAEELAPEQDLVADLGIDSPKALELLCDIEDECGIEIPDDAIGQMNTVGDLLAMLGSSEQTITV